MTPAEALVVVRRRDEVLVLLRCPEDGGYWHLAGGAIEPGESDVEAALRELSEEVGLRAESLVPARRLVYEKGVVASAFVAEAPSDWDPVLDHEHTEYRWCSPAAAIALLHWREARELVEAVCAS